jgi:DNA-binding transcriptional LysR family regulator
MPLSDRIGRRLKLHDLRVLMAVAQAGSMSKAAALLNTTQPAISRSIAGLEHIIGVRLLDRSRHGVEPTEYGRALLNGGAAAFDDLHQAIKNVEFLVDPTVGEVKIGSNNALIAGFLPAIFGRLRRQRPGITIHVKPVTVLAQQHRELRERMVDIILGHVMPPIEEDITASILFHERSFVATGPQSKWARRRKIALSELANEPWAVPWPDSVAGSLIADAFRANGMAFPPVGAAVGTIHLSKALLEREPFLAIVPGSLLRLGAAPQLKVLPVNLPIPPQPMGIMTLKNRTLSPVVQFFIDCAREVAKPLAKRKA